MCKRISGPFPSQVNEAEGVAECSSKTNFFCLNMLLIVKNVTQNDFFGFLPLSVFFSVREITKKISDFSKFPIFRISKYRSLFIRHVRTHTGKRPYKCDHCDYAASEKRNLERHIRTHTGEKPYKCHHCDYAAIQKGDLECHMWTHTGEKPYKCQNCDYTATKKYHLELHMATHTGEKPYKCSQCEYTTNQSHLKSHVRTHTGEKPYKCTRFFRISDFSKIFDFTCFYNCFL